MSKTLKDVRGVDIDCGDTVAVTYYDYDKEKPCLEVSVVEGVNFVKNEIYLDDGEPITLDMFDVIVLPDDYKEW
ncbi:hypothetical protein [Pseudoalteromonas phage PH357]|nr:hypothetical protein [Pseudoalteromonas phage PH357]